MAGQGGSENAANEACSHDERGQILARRWEVMQGRAAVQDGGE